ncbi:MAG: glycosyltransferase, partial [Thermoplasmata archaeon]
MLLSNPHRPDPRVLFEGRALLEAGIGVTLIAWGREKGRPKHSEEDGMRVIRPGPLCPTRSPIKVLCRLPRFWWNALIESKKLEFDLVHAHDFDTLLLGLAVSRLSGRPLLYDAHELYAKMIENEAGPVSNLVWIWERSCVRRADGVITVSDSLADCLSAGRRTRARVVTTSQDPSAAARTDIHETREKYGLTGFVVSYLGALEPGRFVEEFVSSFGPGEKVSLVVAGSGTLEPLVAKASLHN